MSVALPPLAVAAPPSLADQLQGLGRQWRILLLSTLLAPALAGLLLSLSPSHYQATGILLYDPEAASLPGANAASPATELNQDAVMASQSAIVLALPAAAAIATRLHLDQLPEFNPALRKRIFPLSLLPPPAAPDAATLAQTVQKHLAVSVQPGARVIAVSFLARSPALAAAGANLAMQLYLDQGRDVAFQALNDAQNWLEAHSAQVQQQLDETETKLAKARAGAGVVAATQGSTLTGETASRLAASLVEAQAALAMARARLDAATEAGGDAAAANAAVAPNLLPLRTQQAQLASQVKSLASEYGPAYPALVTARAQLSAVTAQIDAEAGREMQAARADVAADEAQVRTLQAALAHIRIASQTEDEESAPVRALEQRAEAGRDMLRAMTLQAGQLAQDASLTRPDARILSLAAVPARPESKHYAIVLSASTVLGLCLGVLLAGLRDTLDGSLRSGNAVREALGVSCHGLLPVAARPEERAITAPLSLYCEQLRGIRTGLGLGEPGRQILAVTAARPAEGKTTLCVSLARMLAASGLRVLAIDGDVRCPSFGRVFGLEERPGLAELLRGTAQLSDALSRDKLTSLSLLCAGGQRASALELFLSPALPALLAALRERYDIILLDVPPAFALAEARVLCRMADLTLLCIRWGSTPRRLVREALNLLREAGAEVAGAALTRVDPTAHARSFHADAEFYAPRYGGYVTK
nr:polysaccharide biosynthesis tyrosine autokinase [uncultured Acidocella sp.]